MQAHEAVKKACKSALAEKRHIKEVVQEAFPDISDLEALFQPENAIGHSVEWVENVLKNYS